ncbi:MAG: DUF4295 domain-containing protein [Bacteroidota bacterium]|nr:DUF4295 domain-containing protein [Bacteroidota bacterium]
MAKKVIATLRKAKDQVKLIRAVKSPKTGAYTFREEMVSKDQLAEVLKSK